MIHLSYFAPLLTRLCFWISTCLCLGHFSWLSLSCALGIPALSYVQAGFGHLPTVALGPCCSRGERLWHPLGAMRAKAEIKKIKDTEEEPPCFPVTGHELTL